MEFESKMREIRDTEAQLQALASLASELLSRNRSRSPSPRPAKPRRRHTTMNDTASEDGTAAPSSRGGSTTRSGTSISILGHLLAKEEQSVTALRLTINSITAQLQSESKRAADAEARARDADARAYAHEIARQNAVADSTRASAEMRVLRMQLESMAREMKRAQEELDALEEERATAEESAAKAKAAARKLAEEIEIRDAREQGRNEGRAEGLRAGMADGMRAGTKQGYARGHEEGLGEGLHRGRHEEHEKALSAIDQAIQEELDGVNTEEDSVVSGPSLLATSTQKQKGGWRRLVIPSRPRTPKGQ